MPRIRRVSLPHAVPLELRPPLVTEERVCPQCGRTFDPTRRTGPAHVGLRKISDKWYCTRRCKEHAYDGRGKVATLPAVTVDAAPRCTDCGSVLAGEGPACAACMTVRGVEAALKAGAKRAQYARRVERRLRAFRIDQAREPRIEG